MSRSASRSLVQLGELPDERQIGQNAAVPRITLGYVSLVCHPLYRILIPPALWRVSRAEECISLWCYSVVSKSTYSTFELFSLFALFVVEHKPLQVLLFNFILKLSTPCMDGQSRCRGDGKLSRLQLMNFFSSTKRNYLQAVYCHAS